MSSLGSALLRASSRYSPRPMPVSGFLIYVFVLAMWLLVIAGAFLFQGILVWSAGLLYLGYDTLLLFYVFLSTRYLSCGGRTPDRLVASMPSAAVLIAARNEAAALPRTIEALLAQTQPPEIILIIDNGSTDDSLAVLRQHYGAAPKADGALEWSSRHPNLAWMQRNQMGKAAALNEGLTHITSEIVFTVDADTILEPDAVSAMCAAFARDPNLAGGCGVLRPVVEMPAHGATLEQRFFQWFQTYEYVRAFISRVAWMRLGALLLVSGAFAAFRRDALLIVGGFDTDSLTEDYELIHRIHRWSFEHGMHWTVRVVGEAKGITDVPGTLSAFLRQRRRWFAGFLQTQYWNRDMTGNHRYGLLGSVMMPIKAIDTLQPVYGLTAFCLLVWFAAHGRNALLPVSFIIAAKIGIDLAFHLWSIHLYAVWTGEKFGSVRFGWALLAALTEPFSFQLMRHCGAVWGWWAFLRGRLNWSPSPVTMTDPAATAGKEPV